METPRTISVDADQAPVCAVCGRQAAADADWRLTWTTNRRAGPVRQGVVEDVERCCDRCSREHLRGIEAKLDPAWW